MSADLDLKFDAERVPLPGDARASDDAIEVLEPLAEDYVTVKRALAYARREGAAKGNDLLRTLQHADGQLALVTWGNTGIEAVGYLPDEQRYDVGGYSAVRDMMGDDPDSYSVTTRSGAQDVLASARPDIVRRADADTLPPLTEAGGAHR